jgi:hypothetical protein
MPAVAAEMAAEEVEEGKIHLQNFHAAIDDSFKRILAS